MKRSDKTHDAAAAGTITMTPAEFHMAIAEAIAPALKRLSVGVVRLGLRPRKLATR